MMDGLVSGRILGQPVERTSKTGKPYALAKVRANAGAGDGEMLIVNVIAFDDAPVAALLGLGDGDSICLSGSLTPKVWVDRDGVARPSVDMVAHQVLTAYAVARKRGVAGDTDLDPAGSSRPDGWLARTICRSMTPSSPVSSPAASRGLFISFEGIDGAGKSSHIQGLHDAFLAAGRRVVSTREPGGTPLAEKLRALFLQEPMDALTEALLVFAGRRDHLQQVIEPALARGDVVLCDRFTDATFAYQGAGRGFDLQVLSVLEHMVQARPELGEGALRQPDLTIWFDLPTEVAAERLAGARAPDRFEAEPQQFFARVAAGYAERALAQPGRFARIDSHQPKPAVWQAVRQAVEARGWLSASREEG